MNKASILITLPSLSKGKGGVTHFFNSVLPFLLKKKDCEILEIGGIASTNKTNLLFDQIKYLKKLRKINYDIVHVNPSLNLKSFLRDGLFIFFAKAMNLKVLVFYHGWDISFEKTVEKFLFWFFKKTYQKADMSIVLSSDFKNKLIKWGVKSKIELLTTAVDNNLLSNFEVSQKEYDLNKPVKILFLARIEKEKGIFEILNAFKNLVDKGYNVLLTIAGDGSSLDSAMQYARENISQDRIVFTGYILGIDKIRAFQESDIYCFPSYYGEGMPTSVLEAMAFGLPIVTTDVGGLKDFFEDGEMGVICRSISNSEVTNALEKILDNKEIIMSMSKYNHSYAKANFMASVVADKLLNIYKNIK